MVVIILINLLWNETLMGNVQALTSYLGVFIQRSILKIKQESALYNNKNITN